MAIVCGTDFSEPSLRAETAAAQLAARMQVPLHLVYALPTLIDDESGEVSRAIESGAVDRLRAAADRLRTLAGSVEAHVVPDSLDKALRDVASRVSAKLIVVAAAVGGNGETVLGGQADRIAQRSHIPVILVRDAVSFENWVREARPLRIVLGADSSMSSETAMRWINEFRAFGPCDVVAVHLYWPPGQFQRLGLGGVRSCVDAEPEVTRTLERELAERFSRLPGSGPVRYRLIPNLGRVADRLAELAAEEHADLVVVGSHARNALERLWHGSVSHGLLRRARSSVVCVPPLASATPEAIPTLSDVLVATDFSQVGDAAIPLAYALTARGGTVHLIHIVKVSPDPITPHDVFAGGEAFDAVRKQLFEKVPVEAASREVTTHVHILQSLEPAEAICQAAERLSVDLVCLGTHGRSGVGGALLGSVAQEVLSQSRRPVLLCRAPVA